jgi:4-amino-4-deoxy-L-arabinose transferase-like glycosyltransferase
MHSVRHAIPRSVRERLPFLVLVVLSIPILFVGLGSYSLVNGDEALYHCMAEEMARSGDFSRLEFKGHPRAYDTFMNAPIQYWARALLIQWFGSNYWTMRILSAMMALASVLVTLRLARLLGGLRAGFLAGLIQLTTLQFVYLHSGRTGELEPMLCVLYTLVCLLFLRALEQERSLIGHHVCVLLLMNIKLAWVFVPILAELAFFVASPAHRSRLREWLITGLLLLPLGLSWHLYQVFVVGLDPLAVVGEMEARATGSVGSGVGGSFLSNLRLYAGVLAFGSFPYVVAYPIAVFEILRREWRGDGKTKWRVMLLFTLAPVLFFALVSQHYPWYIIPVYPFLSIFVACWLVDIERYPFRQETFFSLTVAATLWTWTTVAATSFNPFVEKATHTTMELGWRMQPGVSGLLGPLLTAGVVGGILWLTRARYPTRLPLVLSRLLIVGLIAYGGVRVASPLAYLGHQSEMAVVHRQLELARADGEAIRYPIDIHEAGYGRIMFYFADDYEIVRNPRWFSRGETGVHFRLYPPGDERAKGRSLSRPALP